MTMEQRDSLMLEPTAVFGEQTNKILLGENYHLLTFHPLQK